jgi:hypothetical protein
MEICSPENPDKRSRRWLDSLSDEDLAFLKRFLLVSGSLKDLAKAYEVSYPTVRLRLDRLIQKVEVGDELNARDAGPFERSVRYLLAEGVIDAPIFKALMEAHQCELEQTQTTNNQ